MAAWALLAWVLSNAVIPGINMEAVVSAATKSCKNTFLVQNLFEFLISSIFLKEVFSFLSDMVSFLLESGNCSLSTPRTVDLWSKLVSGSPRKVISGPLSRP